MDCTCGSEMIPMWRKFNINQLRYDCCASGIHASRKSTVENLQRLLGMEVKPKYFSFYCKECGYGTGMKVHKKALNPKKEG